MVTCSFCAASLAKAAPALSDSFSELNKLVNTLSYQRSGGEPSYLYWGGWLAHNLDSLTTLQDAEGPIIQTGGAVGSLVGQVFHTTASERKAAVGTGSRRVLGSGPMMVMPRSRRTHRTCHRLS